MNLKIISHVVISIFEIVENAMLLQKILYPVLRWRARGSKRQCVTLVAYILGKYITFFKMHFLCDL